MDNIDRAVERDMRRKATSEPKPTPMNGECAVCGKPVAAHLPPRKDPNTPKFCDDHGEDDLRELFEGRPSPPEPDPMERYREH